MAAHNVPLRLFICFATLAMVSSKQEVGLLDILLSSFKGSLPCSHVCIIERYSEFMTLYKDKCESRINETLQQLAGAFTQPDGGASLIQDPTLMCRVVDEMNACILPIFGDLCGRELQKEITQEIINPARIYLNCDKQKDHTLITCLANPSTRIAHLRCVMAGNATVNSRLGNDLSYPNWYDQYMETPKNNLCPLAEDFVKCEINEMSASQYTSICPEDVLRDFQFETKKIADYFLCDPPSNMDALRCFGNPTLGDQFIQRGCLSALQSAWSNKVKSTPPDQLQRTLTAWVLSRNGPVKGLLTCLRTTLENSGKCDRNGWSLTYLDAVLGPLMDYYSNNNRGQCSKRFPPVNTGVSPQSAMSRVQFILQTSLAILLSRSQW